MYNVLLIENIKELINRELVNSFSIVKKRCSKQLNGKDFEGFLQEVLGEYFWIDMTKEDLTELKNNTNRNRQRMKKRWYQASQKEVKNKKGKTILDEVKGYRYMTKEEFTRAFQVENEDELVRIRLEEIKKWSRRKKTNMCDFLYFDKKQPYQIYSAYKNDVILEIIDIIEKHFGGTLTGCISERASELVENPVFAAGKSLLKIVEGLDETSNSTILYNDYYVTEEYILRTFIREPEKVKLHQWYVLDEKDSRIIDLIYDRVKPNFYKDRTVEIDIGDIVKYVYKHPNAHAYKDAEDRIMKLSAYNVMGIIKEGDNIKDTKFSINFFDHAVINTDTETNRRVARIVFGEILHNNYIQNKTIKATSYKLNQLDNPISKILFYPFQKERLEMGVSGSKYICEYNYIYFRHRIRFKKTKKDVNLELIREGIQHLKDKKVFVKSFTQLDDNFLIEFYPLTEAEKIGFGIYLT